MSDRLLFARSLYLPAAVSAAAEAFVELATIAVQVLDSDIEVTITDPDPDVADVIADELANYALSETIVLARRDVTS